MKEEKPGLNAGLLGKKTNNPRQIKRRFQQCQKAVKRLKNKNNILQKQCENQLELQGDIRGAVQKNCQYLQSEVEAIIDSLQSLSFDSSDSMTVAKIRDLLKKTKREILKSKDIMILLVQKASIPLITNKDKQTTQVTKEISKSEQVGSQKHIKIRKRSTSPNNKENALNDEIQKVNFLQHGLTKQKQMENIIFITHNRAFEVHRVLSNRIGEGQAGQDNNNQIGNERDSEDGKKTKKFNKKGCIIMIVIIALVLGGTGVAVYMLFS